MAGRGRSGAAAIGVVAIALAAGVLVLGLGRSALPLPVTIDLRGLGTSGLGARAPLPTVDGRVAAALPLLATGVGLLVARRPSRTALLVLDGVAAPIVVFLVAQLNGITDVGGLVLTYASTAGGVLLRTLQHAAPPAGRPLPLWFAAMLGIVPWGVVALHQVGALLAGGSPPVAVRLLTVVVLAATIAEFVVAWRRRDLVPRFLDLTLAAAPAALLALGALLVG